MTLSPNSYLALSWLMDSPSNLDEEYEESLMTIPVLLMVVVVSNFNKICVATQTTDLHLLILECCFPKNYLLKVMWFFYYKKFCYFWGSFFQTYSLFALQRCCCVLPAQLNIGTIWGFFSIAQSTLNYWCPNKPYSFRIYKIVCQIHIALQDEIKWFLISNVINKHIDIYRLFIAMSYWLEPLTQADKAVPMQMKWVLYDCLSNPNISSAMLNTAVVWYLVTDFTELWPKRPWLIGPFSNELLNHMY